MAGYSLDDLDKHLDNLRAQLEFLNKSLDATDHNAPDWVATDLVSLRNKSGRLQDEMKRFRDQLESDGLATKKVKVSDSSKRRSIEANRAPAPTPASRVRHSHEKAVSPLVDQSSTMRPKPEVESAYVVQHIDVTEEVNRRLRESRLRRLMETPSTSQKRKFDRFEDTKEESGTGLEEDQRNPSSAGDTERTPTKRLRFSGSFEQTSTGKRKGDHQAQGEEHGRFEDRTNVKRRRM